MPEGCTIMSILPRALWTGVYRPYLKKAGAYAGVWLGVNCGMLKCWYFDVCGLLTLDIRDGPTPSVPKSSTCARRQLSL